MQNNERAAHAGGESEGTLRAIADPGLPEHLMQRLPEAERLGGARAARIGGRLKKRSDIQQRVAILQRSRIAPKALLRALYQLADDVAEIVAEDTACKKGCAHCCHIPVAMVQEEANALGRAIGRVPVRLDASQIPAAQGFGYHKPCPFLKENRCSVYEHRPLSCRIHFSLDSDDLLCRLLPEKTVPVPLLDMSALQLLYARVMWKDKLGDIRDFFPPETADAE